MQRKERGIRGRGGRIPWDEERERVWTSIGNLERVSGGVRPPSPPKHATMAPEEPTLV